MVRSEQRGKRKLWGGTAPGTGISEEERWWQVDIQGHISDEPSKDVWTHTVEIQSEPEGGGGWREIKRERGRGGIQREHVYFQWLMGRLWLEISGLKNYHCSSQGHQEPSISFLVSNPFLPPSPAAFDIRLPLSWSTQSPQALWYHLLRSQFLGFAAIPLLRLSPTPSAL